MATRTMNLSTRMAIAVLTCLSCMGAEELTKDSRNPLDDHPS
jgi:hypothetical protein